MADDLTLVPIADDYGAQALEVWHEHRRLARFPADHVALAKGNVLTVFDAAEAVVEQYEAGTWSGAGRGVVCAYLSDRPDCPRCHPAGAKP